MGNAGSFGAVLGEWGYCSGCQRRKAEEARSHLARARSRVSRCI